jgi:hypothetical protein
LSILNIGSKIRKMVTTSRELIVSLYIFICIIGNVPIHVYVLGKNLKKKLKSTWVKLG